MDANLVARELEMALLAKLLESQYVDASSNITMPAAALLHLMRAYLGPELTLPDLMRASEASPLLTWTPYNVELGVADIRSAHGVRLNVYRWDKMAASRAPFERRFAEHVERPRPPIAATTFKGGPLGLKESTFEVRNEGYGTQADVTVTGVDAPDWVEVSRDGNRVALRACPVLGGVYRGVAVVEANVGSIRLPLSATSADFGMPDRDEVTLEELLPEHPDLDRDATEKLVETHLTHLGFERLPGGLFVRRGMQRTLERSNDWWLTEADLHTGSVAASGYPESFTVYADADGKTDKYVLTVQARHGQLDLNDLLDLLDAQAGQRLSLVPYKGGYKATLSPAEPWRTASGHTYWLHGPADKLLEHPEVIETLLRRSDDKNITVNVLVYGSATLPADLIRQHRAGRITVRLALEALPYRLIVCDEGNSAFAPPFGPRQRPATPPQALWELSTPLEGRDYREQAWQRGRAAEGGDDGLLNLELSVAMERLAQALRPAPVSASPVSIDGKRDRLLTALPRAARELGVREAPILAAPLLERFGVTAEEVNAGSPGVRVTAGGYLVLRPQDAGGLREQARYLGQLYGGVIHHSQLRKLAETYTGHRIEPMTFVVASLQGLGWAGNGYRRPRQAWEPSVRELVPFTAQVLAHCVTRAEAIAWLRRHVAASEAQLERALSKAAPLAEIYRAAPKAPVQLMPERNVPPARVSPVKEAGP